MKKSFSYFISIFLCGLIFTGCNSFLDGSGLKNQLDEKIEEAKFDLRIVSISPSDVQGGVDCDSPIIISFNKPVQESTFTTDSYKLYDSKGNDISGHFAKVYHSEDFKTYTIPVEGNNLLDAGQISSVLLVLKSSKILDNSGKPFSTKDYVHSYSINKNTDNVNPLIYSLKVKKNGTEYEIEENKEIDVESIHDASENSVAEKRKFLCSSLDIEYKVFDDRSGIKKLVVSEKTLKNSKGKDVSKVSSELFTEYSAADFKNYRGERTGSYTYSFNSQGQDGIVRIAVYAEDYSGNQSVLKTYYVLRDTNFDYSSPEGLFRNYDTGWDYSAPEWWYPNDMNNLTLSQFFEFGKTIYCSEGSHWDCWYTNDEPKNVESYTGATHSHYLNYKVTYGPENNSDLYKALPDSGKTPVIDGSYFVPYSFDHLQEIKGSVYINEIVSDWAGNTFKTTQVIPDTPVIADITRSGNYFYVTLAGEGYLQDGMEFNVILLDSEEDLNSLKIADIESRTFISDSPRRIKVDAGTYDSSKSYYFVAYVKADRFISYRSNVVKFKQTGSGSSSEAPEILASNSWTSNGLNTGKYTLTVNISEQDKTDFESIYLLVNIDGYDYYYNFDDDSISVELSSDVTYTYSYKLTGIKEGCKFTSNPVELNMDDNVCPSVSFDMDDNACGIYLTPVDYPKGTKENLNYVNDFCEIKVYYKKYDAMRDTEQSTNPLTEEEIKALPYKTVYYDKTEPNAYLSLDFLGDNPGDYAFYYELYDQDDNGKPVLGTEYDLTQNSCIFEFAGFTGDNPMFLKIGDSDKYAIDYFDLDEKQWKNFALLEKNEVISGYSTSDDTLKNSFVRTYAFKEENRTVYQYSVPSYKCVSKNITCSLKSMEKLPDTEDMIAADSKVFVLRYNEPVFVETVYSSVNFGNDISKWNRWCGNSQRSNPVLLTSDYSLSTYTANYKEFPAGSYWAVIVHYADGSADISDVYHKD